MKKTYDELKEEFDKNVEELQTKCKHEDVSEWMDEWWAIMHSTGWVIKRCNICNKVVARKTICSGCEKELIEGVDVIKTVSSSSYCEKCAPKAEAEEKERLRIFECSCEKLINIGKGLEGSLK